MSKTLVEKWNPLLESDKAKPFKNKEILAQILENQETYVNEAVQTVSGDIQSYTPILVPAVRRIFPNLLANELVGVQPMSTPTGYAYALRASYNAGAQNNTLDRGTVSTTQGARGVVPTFTPSAVVVVCSAAPTGVVAGTSKLVVGTAGSGYSTELGTIIYQEGSNILVNLVAGKYASDVTGAALLETTGGPGVSGYATEFTAVACVPAEIGYNTILKNYIGTNSTAVGEQLSLSTGSMKSVRMGLERVTIEAQTRKLGAEYTIELAQDLKAIHGLDAEAELINILEYEIAAEIDRELVDVINTNASNAGFWSYSSVAGISGVFSDGRWEMEKFRTLYTKIVSEANKIALSSRRGAGNFIIASVNVITALEMLPNFMYSAVPGNVEVKLGVAKVGTIDGRFSVYLDTFATSDYVTVGYKGPSAFDTGVIYCPYVPLMLQKVTDPNTFQPKLGFMTRDAISGNMFGTGSYYRKFSVDLSNSPLTGLSGISGYSSPRIIA